VRLLGRWLSVMAIAALAAPVCPVAAQARLQDVVCESTGNRFKQCPVQTGGTVRLMQNISNTRCEFERTWGFDYDGIWVDQGCRARFRIGGNGGAGWQSGNYGRKLTCESRNDRYQFCETQTRGDVRLSRQLSTDSCVAGRSWGFEHNGIWVSNGCRAEFEIGYTNVNWVGGNRTVVCESRDGQYSRCRVWTYGDVRLTRQLSNTRCVQNRTWGFDQNGIWVNGGCRAEFTVGRGGGGWGPGNPGGGPVSAVEAQAVVACQNKARATGFTGTSSTGSDQTGSIVQVSMQGSSGGRRYDMKCVYRITQRTAMITQQTEVGFGGGGGSELTERAARACDAEARRQGLQVLQSGPSELQHRGIRHSMVLRRGGIRYPQASCRYVTSSGRATISLESPESGWGNESDLYRRAEQVCGAEASRQGYQVLQSGPAKLESWGARQKMVLRRGGVDYQDAYCNYQSSLNRAALTAGQPAQPYRPAPQPR
jgi:Protein of unknown function (DUF3011)